MQSTTSRKTLGRTLTSGLLDELGRRIVTGDYAQHPFPTEAQLELEYTVSRSVIREAVKMLTAKGLLTAKPRMGTAVLPSSSWNLFDTDVLNWLLERKFSINLLLQFTDLRMAIEPAASALAAIHGDGPALQLIATGFDRMQNAEHGGDDPLESDIAFHVAILQASGNDFFKQFRDVVSTALRTSIRFTNSRVPGHTADLPRHKAVLDAITKRKATQARTAMTDLLTMTRNLMVSTPRGKAAVRTVHSK